MRRHWVRHQAQPVGLLMLGEDQDRVRERPRPEPGRERQRPGPILTRDQLLDRTRQPLMQSIKLRLPRRPSILARRCHAGLLPRTCPPGRRTDPVTIRYAGITSTRRRTTRNPYSDRQEPNEPDVSYRTYQAQAHDVQGLRQACADRGETQSKHRQTRGLR